MKQKIISVGLILLSLSQSVYARPTTQVKLTWDNESLPLKMQVYTVKKEKAAFISETGVAKTLQETPAVAEVRGPITATLDGGTPEVLIMKNDSDQDVYFFAVPHEMNPHHASAGHYFECLCIGRVYKVPKKSVWYRIVRINLNNSFEKLKSFEINHKLIGLTKAQVDEQYKDRLYEKE